MSDFIKYGRHWMWLSIGVICFLMLLAFQLEVANKRLAIYGYYCGPYESLGRSEMNFTLPQEYVAEKMYVPV